MNIFYKQKYIVVFLLVFIIILSACTDKKFKNPFAKNANLTIEENKYINSETGVGFEFDINLTPVTKKLYEDNKENLDKHLENKNISLEVFQKNLDNVDITFYDFKDMKYITRLSYVCSIDDDFRQLNMEDDESLKLLKSSLKEGIIEGSDFMEEADFNMGNFEKIPYVKYSFPDEITGIKVVAIQTLIVENDKLHSFSFFTDGDEYINSINYLHQILESFTVKKE